MDGGKWQYMMSDSSFNSVVSHRPVKYFYNIKQVIKLKHWMELKILITLNLYPRDSDMERLFLDSDMEQIFTPDF